MNLLELFQALSGGGRPQGVPPWATPAFNPQQPWPPELIELYQQMGQSGMPSIPPIQPPQMQMPETPPPTRLQNIFGKIGGAVRMGLDAASTPNVAGGGPVDTIRAITGAMEQREGRDLNKFKLSQMMRMDRQREQGDAIKMYEFLRKLKEDQDQAAHNRTIEKAKADTEARAAEAQKSKDLKDWLNEGKGKILTSVEYAALPEERKVRVQKVGDKFIYVFTPEEMAESASRLPLDVKSQVSLMEKGAYALPEKRTGVATAGTGFGVPVPLIAEQDVPVPEGEFAIPGTSGARRLVMKKKVETEKPSRLVFSEDTDENTGDVTRTGYDAITGEEKTRQIRKAVAKKRPPAAASMGVVLTPAAIEQAAEMYRTTGQLPALGMGTAGAKARQGIINRAGELGGDIAANKAEYTADRTALADLSKRRNQIVSFERTAQLNLDLFTEQAKKVVDTGSPILNRAFRGAQRTITGNTAMAGFDAARVTAFTEVSRVLSGAMGTQLSDAARHEAEMVLRGDYTIPQLMRASAVLKQDMENRKASLDEQISIIEKRIRSRGQAPAVEVTAPKRKVWNPQAGKFEDK